jgi:transcriptional regulator with XRE-family HTH domain
MTNLQAGDVAVDLAQDNPYRDPSVLKTLYVEEGMAMSEVADVCGCSISTISRYLQENGIEARGRGHALRKPGLTLEMDNYGYIRWHGTRSESGEREDYGFTVHRLLAIAEYGADAVTPDTDVHHKNGIPWDNRVDNIELKNHAQHAHHHATQGGESNV